MYEAPKDAAPAARNADPHTHGTAAPPPAAAGVGQAPEVVTAPLRWTLPAGWQELPASQMRVGHFSFSGDGESKAQVTIIPMGGMAGGDVENVNRWRGQVSLSRISAEEIAKLAEAVDIGGAPGRLWDFAGETPDEGRKTRLLAAILVRDGTSWFFKCLGDDALVAAQKPAFVGLLKSIQFGGETAATVTPTAPAAPPVTPTPAVATEAASASALKPPAHWKAETPGAMQLAKYAPQDAAGKVEITVVVLPGEAGGRLANVNRWRRQLGLEPLTETELAGTLSPLEVAGAQTYLTDFANPATKRRMVAAGVTRGEQTWFYKLTGEEALVAREQAAFLEFIRTTRHDR